MGDHEQKDFSEQDSQYNKDSLSNAGPPVFIVDLWEKVSGRQGAGEEQRPDEQRFKEAVIKTAEYNRHQKNGDYPVGYDQKPFHLQHKYSKRTGVLPIKKSHIGDLTSARGDSALIRGVLPLHLRQNYKPQNP